MKMARHCIDVNIFGTLAMCKEVGRRMAERRSGKIVNIGSVVGYVATPWAGTLLGACHLSNFCVSLR
jgi:short-subunit dehydrogenase